MKRVWTFVLFLFLSLCAMASEGSASLFTPYPGQNGGQTRAPFGYKPFYISHFGRHGCRYMSSGEQVAVVLDVLEAAHPSPLAGGAFFGCRHFSKTNKILVEEGKTPINWQL